MATKLRQSFLESQEGKDTRHILQLMTLDDLYNTISSYSTNTLQYPDNLIPFTDKHMNYLNAHPELEASQYVANIKLMSRIKR
jgi:hypothetical protein